MKVSLGLVLPLTNTVLSSSGKREAGFWVVNTSSYTPLQLPQ